jgi:hypothetical protein
MPDFEKQFDAFNLSEEKANELKRLERMPFLFSIPSSSFVIETVLIENGKRLVIKTETQNAELV